MSACAALLLSATVGIAQSAVPSATAQTGSRENTGLVIGQISNEGTKDYLQGAVIQVDGSTIATVSNETGGFRLSLPSGNHTLVVSYSGLTTKRVPVTVQAGQMQQSDIALTTEIYSLEPFIVKGVLEGSAAAIMRQREAMNSKTVTAIDAFGNPASSVGELIQRMAGVAVDVSGGGETGAIYIRGLNQSFSTMMLDGNTMPVSDGQTVGGKYVYLGQVATGNLESVELIKAPLPDMDGNAISGYLNLKTKRAFDRAPGRNIMVTVGTKFADNGEHKSLPGRDRPKLDLFSVSYSDVLSVLGGKNNLGLLAQINVTASSGTIHEAGPFLATAYGHYFIAAADPKNPLPTAWNEGHWSGSGDPSYVTGMTFNADYKINKDAIVYFKSSYNTSKYEKKARPSYMRWQLTAPANVTTFEPGSTWNLTTTKPVGTVDLHSTLYGRFSESATFATGYEQKLFSGSAKFNIDGSFSETISTYPAINEVHAQVTGVAFQIDRRGQDRWLPKVTQVGGPNWSDPANYNVSAPVAANGASRIIHFNVPSTTRNIKADFQKDFDAIVPAYIKVGVKRSMEKKESDRFVDVYTWNGPTTGGIAPYVAYNATFGEGRYGPFPMLQIPTTGLPGDLWKNPANFRQTMAQVWNSQSDALAGHVQTWEQISSAYVQSQVKLNRLRILGGLRVEETEAIGAGFKRKPTDATNNANESLSVEENRARARSTFTGWVTRKAEYTNVFPGIHFVYQFNKNFQARASYNVSISRPGAANYTPGITANDVARTLTANNVELKPYTSDNFDAGVEYYFEPVGTLSATVFLKEISNYTRTISSVVPEGPDNGFNGDYAGYTWNKTSNVGGAHVRGIELNYSQQYTFLPGILRGLGTYANITLLQTKGDFGGVTTVTQLANFTPRTMNAGLTFKGYGLSLRLLANYRGETYMGSIRVSGSAPAETNSIYGRTSGGIIGIHTFDYYNRARLQFDLKTEYTINRIYSVYLDVFNLTNGWNFERVVKAFDFESPWTAQRTGIAFSAGVKARF
ncbi:MAG: TonB-dependent receptor [Opitutae bacterium]|nr:TonB-dependent receptor [Opitutae bacterium]